MKEKKRTLGSIKLNQYSKAELDRQAKNLLKGGGASGCSCGGYDNSRSYWKLGSSYSE